MTNTDTRADPILCEGYLLSNTGLQSLSFVHIIGSSVWPAYYAPYQFYYAALTLVKLV